MSVEDIFPWMEPTLQFKINRVEKWQMRYWCTNCYDHYNVVNYKVRIIGKS
jgi:hypothetical protein